MRIHRLLLSLACLALSVGHARAGYKIYMQAPGLFGVTDDPAHTGWLEIQTVNHGVGIHYLSTDTLFPSGQPEIQDFNFTRPIDLNSPALLLRTANGKRIYTVTVDFVTTGETPQTFLRMVFTNVMMRSNKVSGENSTANGRPMEQLSFSSDKIQWIYRFYRADGALDREIKTGWDLTTQTPF